MGRAFIGNFKGPKGDTGPQGAQGIQGIQGPVGPTGAVDGNTPIEFTEAGTLVNIESGESISTIFGKTKKILGSLLVGAGSTLLGKNLTANQALVSDGAGKVNVSGISATELGYLSGATKNIQSQLNEQTGNIENIGIAPYARLIVTEGMTDAQIDDWIRSSFAGGAQRLQIYNDKTNYKFGQIGNFNIWIFGNSTTEGTGIVIDHWSQKMFTIRINYPDGEISVEHLAKYFYFRDGNIDAFPPGIAWVNGWGDITGNLPFRNKHSLYIGTGIDTNGQCNIQHMTEVYSGQTAIRYRENSNESWTNWAYSLAEKTAPLDINGYTWTSGSATVNRIGDMVFVVLGILNVTCASSGKLLKIPDGFTPNNWTSIPFLYKQKGQDQMVCGSADISEGYIIPTVALENAHVILNAHWKI